MGASGAAGPSAGGSRPPRPAHLQVCKHRAAVLQPGKLRWRRRCQAVKAQQAQDLRNAVREVRSGRAARQRGALARQAVGLQAARRRRRREALWLQGDEKAGLRLTQHKRNKEQETRCDNPMSYLNTRHQHGAWVGETVQPGALGQEPEAVHANPLPAPTPAHAPS